MTFDKIVAWCAPWNHLFGHSKLISGGVLGVHIMMLFLGGGLATAADRMTLRIASGDAAMRGVQLREVDAVHPLVLVAIVMLFISGVLLAAADVETFLPSPIFWIKLVLVALLLVNGALLTGVERRLRSHAEDGASSVGDREWGRVRLFSIFSVVLWTATAVVGIVLSNVA